MADTATSVNGIYGSQYAQPAELAASTPSGPSHALSASQSTTTSTGAAKAEAQEIGWYFVEQYYTTLSKSPERIHLFYNKKSQLVTGVEAEKVLPSVGAKAISEKIKSLDISDCKVRVLNVDSQSSFSNIVVQVIGEMSNKNQPHHKFVQTFVLAEQPNGYFVLNDIFRYLNEDEDEIVDDEPARHEVPVEEPPTPVDSTVETPAFETVESEEAVEKVDEELESVKDEEEEPIKAVEDSEPAEVTTENEEASLEAAPSEPVEDVAENVAEEETLVEEITHEEAAEEAPVQQSPPKAATTVPEAPPAKKTWASMVGGKAPTVPAVPSQAPAPAAAVAQPKAPRATQQSQGPKASPSEPASATTPTSQGNGWQMAGDTKKGKAGPQAKAAEANVLAYIKNVNEKVDARTLREVLEGYGELKYFDVSRPRNCAFVEFATPEGYAAAVAANPHTVNTETVSVEERRPRPGAYGGQQGSGFVRGNGTAPRGGGRGNMQQRSGSQGQGSFPKDAGRGTFQQQRGSKSGNVTPKGRGQPQAV